jgi:transglutaminase 1
MMQCGPAPIKAIKKGAIYIGYDTGFLFSEVNADQITWICKETENTCTIKSMGNRYTRKVGLNISTKAIGWGSTRQVLTNDYKYAEDTVEERKAWQNAYSNCSRPDYFNEFLDAKDNTEISIDLSLSPEIPMNGDDLTFNLTVKTDGDLGKTINVNSVLHSTLYTGQKKNLIFKHAGNNLLLSKEEQVFSFTVPFEEYQG